MSENMSRPTTADVEWLVRTAARAPETRIPARELEARGFLDPGDLHQVRPYLEVRQEVTAGGELVETVQAAAFARLSLHAMLTAADLLGLGAELHRALGIHPDTPGVEGAPLRAALN